MNKNNSDLFNHVVFVNHMGQPRNYYMLNPKKAEYITNCKKQSNINGKLENDKLDSLAVYNEKSQRKNGQIS